MLTDRQGDCCVLTSSGWCRSSPARGCLVWVPSLSLWFLALADIAPGDDSVWAVFLRGDRARDSCGSVVASGSWKPAPEPTAARGGPLSKPDGAAHCPGQAGQDSPGCHDVRVTLHQPISSSAPRLLILWSTAVQIPPGLLRSRVSRGPRRPGAWDDSP